MFRGFFLIVVVFTACATSAELDALPFSQPATPICQAEGRFPDPTDCNFYIDCKGNLSSGFNYTITPCPAGTYYNACLGDCSTTERPVDCTILCTADINGAISVSTENPEIYFMCFFNETGPYILIDVLPGVTTSCPAPDDFVEGGCNGTYYYGDNKNCSVYYYCSGRGDEPFPMVCQEEKYFISYNHSCVGYICSSPGFFADPGNCAGYYYCSLDNRPQHFTCPDGSYFDSSSGGCHLGNCSNTCPSAGGSDDNGGGGGGDGGDDNGGSFTCKATGFFADPNNCTRFYFCDLDLNPTLFQCASGTYFDENIGGCVKGQCGRRKSLSTKEQHDLLSLQLPSVPLHHFGSTTINSRKRKLKEAGLLVRSVDD